MGMAKFTQADARSVTYLSRKCHMSHTFGARALVLINMQLASAVTYQHSTDTKYSTSETE